MWTIVTTMDDVSDPAVQVFGPFVSKRQAISWAKRDRDAMALEFQEENGDDPRESFDQDGEAIYFGSFKWMPVKATNPKKKKSKRA